MPNLRNAGWISSHTASDLPLAFFLGGGVFLLALPISILNPTNIAWLQHEDLAAHYLGWAFFRDAPAGASPGQNLAWGLELASSIFYSDSIPFLALPSRWLNPILPRPFQYFGFWLLSCFVLQAWFAVRLARQFGLSRFAGAGFALITCLFPPFVVRMSQHVALSAHWLILAAFYEYFRESVSRSWRWAWVALLAALVHAYLLAMVLAIFLAALVRDGLEHRVSARHSIFGMVGVVAAVVSALWTGGFFEGAGQGRVGYGLFQANLLAPFDPDAFSAVLPDLPNAAGNYEGYSYLGLGGLVLVAAGAWAFVRSHQSRRARGLLPLLAVLAVMLVYAVSNRLTLGEFSLELFPMPEIFDPITGGLRSSGRFVWPALYALLLAVYVTVWRRFGKHAQWFVVVVLAVQVIDISPALASLRQGYLRTGSQWASPLRAAIWQQVAQEKLLLRKIPAGNRTEDWDVFAAYALEKGLATDSVYLGRIDEKQLTGVQRRAEGVVTSARGRDDTAYVLDRRAARSLMARERPNASLVGADGFLVLIPQSITVAGVSGAAQLMTGEGMFAELGAGETVGVSAGTPGHDLTGLGWKPAWKSGIYAQGEVSELVFLTKPTADKLRLRLLGECLTAPPAGVRVFVNDQQLSDAAVRSSDGALELTLQGTMMRISPHPNVVSFHWGQPVADLWNLRQARASCKAPLLKTVSLYSGEE